MEKLNGSLANPQSHFQTMMADQELRAVSQKFLPPPRTPRSRGRRYKSSFLTIHHFDARLALYHSSLTQQLNNLHQRASQSRTASRKTFLLLRSRHKLQAAHIRSLQYHLNPCRICRNQGGTFQFQRQWMSLQQSQRDCSLKSLHTSELCRTPLAVLIQVMKMLLTVRAIVHQ
jgi:hypothetical protein